MTIKIPQFKVNMSPDAGPAVAKTLDSGYIGQGEKVEEFEQLLQDTLGYKFGVTVNSGTAAITMALILAGVGPGTEVITTPMTCSATNEPIALLGATIVWADVDKYGNISPGSIYDRITAKTKAVVAVDWGGLPCAYENIRKVIEHSEKKNGPIPIIQDAAHSICSIYNNLPITESGGDYQCYSFQAIKHLTTGDGGLLVTPEYDYEEAKLMRWYGLDRTTGVNAMRCRQDISVLGSKWHMNDINASIGIANIPLLADSLSHSREVAKTYNRSLLGYNVNTWPYNRTSSHWLYTIHVNDPIRFEGYMAEKGIAVSQTHNRNDVFSIFKQFKDKRYPLKGLDEFFATMCCIPIGWWLSDYNVAYITQSVIEYNNTYGLPQL